MPLPDYPPAPWNALNFPLRQVHAEVNPIRGDVVEVVEVNAAHGV
jgi:hypothetical protein